MLINPIEKTATDAILQRLHDAVNTAVGKRMELQATLRDQDILLAVMQAVCPAEFSIAVDLVARMKSRRHAAGVDDA